ncbi:type VI secretion system protein ImpG [Chromobacterium alkanivorans]|uniref:type VI secretion system baseplate subunit TssF n=1 Tax=Chromobacterium TaxID=535 RepID=UPI0006531F91|nr:MULTISPECIES: type VI secretion system baseplate subunit TssF [Chromobacterium]KMN77966.1 type VI secretion protein [Chromobacterium sp. LK11]MBN3002842.1 type VI secretion system baseplate subunit TssF [Chromobacterium alkanivorans]MCS3803999.1 type VI secretion system protein ImpG [Chromobacterium alkanivorans]MCS3817896.1 type VI secretion system protein ImpG [Chromobacterium alkanivorans]MCS3875516.1 type VI secretion system protein ImpG [Chromobacterium alkanivorans]
MNFLDHYNNELRHLREAGARFAREHPQIAPALGLRPNSVADPFVERLLEGVAFLSARVQTRLDLECAEFARQALAQVCPLYLSATPAISSFAFHPDFASPEAFRGRSMPRGTLIQATLPGSARPVTFATGREVTLLPLRLERAECGRGLARLSAELARRLASSQAALRLSFKLEGTVALGELAAVEGGAKPLQLSLAGDLPRAYALHRAMLADVGAWYATADDGRGGEVLLELPLSGLRLSAADEDEALLPADPGGLPGLRLLREYFAQPARLLSVELDALAALAARAPAARGFELILALRQAPLDLIGEVDAGQFRLFATPAINLYPKRLDPVPYDPNQTEQWIPVDRMRPAEHHLWRLLEINVCDSNGRSREARPALDAGGYQSAPAAARYSLRREPALQSEGPRQARPDALGSHDLITISASAGDIGLDDIATLTGRALVADRGWRPEDLPAAELRAEGGAVARLECLWPASAPRPIPDLERCWQAVAHIGLNPLSLRGAGRQDIVARLAEQLRLAAQPELALDRQRIDSLKAAHLQAGFLPAGRGSPQALVRAALVDIDISAVMHADRGGWLFGRLLAQALAQAVTLNDGIEVSLRLDGELVSRHGNTLRADGELQ